MVKDGISQFQNIPQISRTLLYANNTVLLGFHKFSARLFPKMLTGARKTQRRTSALTLLEQYRQDGDEFLTHIVKADEIWV
jgi:hypothetical protein